MSKEITYFTSGTSRVIAGCFSLAAFCVAVIAGLASDNPASMVLGRALMSMFLCYPLGWVIGSICQHVIVGHIAVHKEANPAPDSLKEFPVNSEGRRDDDGEIIDV